MLDLKNSLYFLLACLAILTALVCFIIQPFLTPLILAAVFAFLFQPVYRGFLKIVGNRPSLASFTTTIIIFMLIVVPIFVLGYQVFQESTYLYSSNNLPHIVALVTDKLYTIAPDLRSVTIEIDINQYLERALEVIIQNLGIIFSNVAKIVLGVFVFLVTCYFLLKDGEKLEEYFVKISPLENTYNRLIISRLESAVLSVAKDTFLIGLIQGAIAGVGFALLGVPNALLWGSTTIIAALIPAVGTTLVTFPIIVFMFFSGNVFSIIGIILLALVVGLTDNVLRPKLMSKETKLHPLAVFLMVIGGITFFGPVGLILGPLVMIILLTCIDIYFSIKNQKVIM